MWLRPILISCEISCSNNVLLIFMKSGKSQAVVSGSKESRALSEISHRSMNGENRILNYLGVLGTVLGL